MWGMDADSNNRKRSPGCRNESAEVIKGVTQRDRLRSEDIRAELQMKSILQFIEEMQLIWYGRMRRMASSRTAQRWLEWKPVPPGPEVDRGNDGWTTSRKLSKSEDPHWRRLNTQHCYWTGKNGETSSLTGHRPTSTAVQVQVIVILSILTGQAETSVPMWHFGLYPALKLTAVPRNFEVHSSHWQHNMFSVIFYIHLTYTHIYVHSF